MENQKSELRKKLILYRNNLTIEEVREKNERIIDTVIKTDEFKKAKTVMLYKSINNEVRIEDIDRLKMAEDKRLLYPVCISNTEISAFLPKSFKKGDFGITEPDTESSIEVLPEEIDLVICPGTGFDSMCNRLGMGGGFYDRFLKKCKNAAVIMAAYEIQRCDNIPTEETDRAMDMVITEKKIYKRNKQVCRK